MSPRQNACVEAQRSAAATFCPTESPAPSAGTDGAHLHRHGLAAVLGLPLQPRIGLEFVCQLIESGGIEARPHPELVWFRAVFLRRWRLPPASQSVAKQRVDDLLQ